jgi:hypothetical protein
VFLCSLFFVEIAGQWLYFGLRRPRPYGVPIIASWGGYSAPSPPAATLTIFLVGAIYCLAVPGRPRGAVRRASALHRRTAIGPAGGWRGHLQRTASLWLNSDQAGMRAVTITLAATCNTSGAQQIPSDQVGTRRFERPLTLAPQFSDLRLYTFPGGCATYQFRFAAGTPPVQAVVAGSALTFLPRSVLVDYVRHTEGLTLCGRRARCPG